MASAGRAASSMNASALSAAVYQRLVARGETIASAESLTGGALGTALTETPGSAKVYRGGVITYATDLKSAFLDVDPDLLAEHGPVHPEVARQMAEGIRSKADATWGISTTGVAGPGSTDDGPEGLVYIGLAGPHGSEAHELRLPPGRDQVRATTIERALELLLERLG